MLTEIAGDASLDKFRAEYEKLHGALVSSHDSEKRLVAKCRDLNAEIVANAAKVQTALKLSEEDQATITGLKGEIEKAWKMVDATKEKESRAKETIQQLKLEIADLSAEWKRARARPPRSRTLSSTRSSPPRTPSWRNATRR